MTDGVDRFTDNNAMFSAYAEKWTKDYLEKQYKSGKFNWTKETAQKFAEIDIETLLFDPYFLNAKDWLYPGIADVILDIYEKRKKSPITLVAVLGGFGCLPSYAPIKTNDGYITIGESKIGDKILGVKGDTTEECNIINKTYSGKKEVFRIYCKDGNYVDATKEHIFPVRYRSKDSKYVVDQKWNIAKILLFLDNNLNKYEQVSFVPVGDNASDSFIVDYISLGEMETYDITIDNDSHLFLTFGDFKCSNSGKTAGIGGTLIWLEWFRFSCKYAARSKRACPQEFYKLKPTSKVAFIALSKTVEKSKLITFSEMIPPFLSGFNKDYFPINPRIKSMIDIPGNNTIIFPNTATEAANAGYSIFSFVMDEISFLEIIDGSSRTKGSGSETYDQAAAAYMSAEGRRKSRFRKDGYDDGLGILISSVNYDEDYLVSRIREAYHKINDKGVFYKVLLPWKVDPDKAIGKDHFYFDTNKYQVVKDERQIRALDEYYVDVPIEDIIFGNADEDPNDKLLLNLENGNLSLN
ncbi:hypothetical protein D4R42_04015 [bacterium]|nr:MAG: hypothetical protein D4R42_04015 [bacterium]